MGRNVKQNGFTLIEMLMVIMLVAILAAVAIPQFIDFRSDAKNASVNSALGAVRTAIASQTGQMLVRCSAPSGTLPTTAQINANDITTGGAPCTGAMVPSVGERSFTPNQIPDNPWSGSAVLPAGRHVVITCGANGCLRDGTVSCDGATAWGTGVGGWCYNPATGAFWANSNNNGVAAPNGEYAF